jgi:RND family efflux transporter MFP subunit
MLAACGAPSHSVPAAQAAEVAGEAYVIRDTTVSATLTATGVAEPFAQSTLSTKLMGTVLSVSVAEGDRVARGQPLLRIDARDIDAKREQTSAAIASAEAVQREAALNASRWRALYADSAAPRAQLDAAEAALTRADAGVQSARAMLGELSALGDYATVRAPFAGIVTRRFVDPGAFAAPGAPLLTLQDGSRLRVSVAVPPTHAAHVRRGMTLPVTVEGSAAESTVEGVVPAGAGELFTINALVPNRDGRLPVGGAATLSVPAGKRSAVLVPGMAIRREGDLTGVTVVQRGVSTVRWVRLGPARQDFVEVLAGLRAGDTIRVPHATPR